MVALFFRFIAQYWKALFSIIYPLALLPIFLCNNIAEMRCLYCVALMAGLWVTEALPLAITSILPVVLFPLMGILDSSKTSMNYFKETNMMFVGGIIIAIAIQHCGLHIRISLMFIKMVGVSHRRLHFGLMTMTMLVSMWISNTAAAAMMIPIIEATLLELENAGIGRVYEEQELEEGQTEPNWDKRKPTGVTLCYFVGTAYASGIGGLGTIVGTGTNLTFKGLFENRFPESEGIDFVKWMMLNIPMMLVANYLTYFWLQIYYMGLFRPHSKDAQAINVGTEGEDVVKGVIKTKLEELGPMSFHETAIGILFLLAVFLWCFRQPMFIPGWAERITKTKVKDSNPAFIVVLLMFYLPAVPSFIYFFSKDEEKRPKENSPALIGWKLCQQKVPWGLVFLLGGGFAIADASQESGMSALIADKLRSVAELPKYTVVVIASTMAVIMTQIMTSNVACANILLPVLAEMARAGHVNPLYLMVPVTIACSYAYCLPSSTPPNAIASDPINMTSFQMLKVGFVTMLLSMATLLGIFPFLAPLIYKDMVDFPDWAEEHTTKRH